MLKVRQTARPERETLILRRNSEVVAARHAVGRLYRHVVLSALEFSDEGDTPALEDIDDTGDPLTKCLADVVAVLDFQDGKVVPVLHGLDKKLVEAALRACMNGPALSEGDQERAQAAVMLGIDPTTVDASHNFTAEMAAVVIRTELILAEVAS